MLKVRDTSTVKYPEPFVRLHYKDGSKTGKDGHHDPITVEQMKELLGWETESDYQARIGADLDEEGRAKLWGDKSRGQYGNDYLLRDLNGNKVRCTNNTKNREFVLSHCLGLMQEHLNRRWRYNGESASIGKYGSVLSGAHTFISAILAEQARTGKDAEHWAKFWNGPITVEKNLAFGIDEVPEVTQTLDNVRPRSFADVLFADTDIYGDVPRKDRAKLTNFTRDAILCLWARTGAKFDPYAPRATHSEARDFLARHDRIKKAVKHVWQENQGTTDDPNRIYNYVPVGTAAALLYLMAACDSDRDEYRRGGPTEWCESRLDLRNWHKAQEFWSLLASRNKEVEAVAIARRRPMNGDKSPGDHIFGRGVGSGSISERVGVLIKAWSLFRRGVKITVADLYLDYVPLRDRPDEWKVDPQPCLGGPDVAAVRPPDEATDEEYVHPSHIPNHAPGHDEIRDRAEEIKKEAMEQTRDKVRPPVPTSEVRHPDPLVERSRRASRVDELLAQAELRRSRQSQPPQQEDDLPPPSKSRKGRKIGKN